ncbi:DUF4382 domain-containing protein [Chloroflexota bacterium]
MKKRTSIVFAIIASMALLGLSCNTGTEVDPGGTTITGNNFRFLISDEVNAISEFSSLEVSISGIGVQKAGESGGWIELEPAVATVDLVSLQGLNATEIWSGDLEAGQYTKAFIYVDDVIGTLKTGEAADVSLPSGRIEISTPFVIAEDGTVQTDSPVSFVYDITVIEAGDSGNYVLQPEVDQSGATQSFFEVGEGDLAIQLEGLIEVGETASIFVYYEGDPVEGATVEVEDAELDGLTDATGMITFVIPDDGEIKIKAEWDDKEGELEIDMEREDELEDEDEDEDEDLIVTAVGDIVPGEIATIRVTNEQGPVEGAYVEVNDEELEDQTDAGGLVSFTVPQEAEVEIKVFFGNSEGELESELGEDLNLELVGELVAGEEVTLAATFQGTATEGATVIVNDEVLDDTTDENGEVSFVVPTDADEIEIKAELGDLEGELEIKLGNELNGQLMIQVQGTVTPGDSITIRVSVDGRPVQGVTVTVDDEVLDDTTDENGEVSFVVPIDAEEIEIEAELGDLEGSITLD